MNRFDLISQGFEFAKKLFMRFFPLTTLKQQVKFIALLLVHKSINNCAKIQKTNPANERNTASS